MKKINIDQLPKKTPYKLPEGSFEEIQNKVLAKVTNIEEITSPKRPTKIFSIGWKYASAAAIVLLFGLSFFLFNNLEMNKPANSVAEMVDSNFKVDNYNAHLVVKGQTEDQVLARIYNTESKVSEESSTSDSKNKTEKPVVKSPKNDYDDDMEVFMTVYTSNEMAKLSKEAEQDVYLDIFH